MFPKISKIEIKTEPPPTKKLSETQLDEVVNGTSSIIELCELEKVHCHTQVCFSFWVEFLKISAKSSKIIGNYTFTFAVGALP